MSQGNALLKRGVPPGSIIWISADLPLNLSSQLSFFVLCNAPIGMGFSQVLYQRTSARKKSKVNKSLGARFSYSLPASFWLQGQRR
jgi:hypothetical protein